MSLGQLSLSFVSRQCLSFFVSRFYISSGSKPFSIQTTDSISLGGDFDFGYVKLTTLIVIRLSQDTNTAERAGYDSFSGVM